MPRTLRPIGRISNLSVKIESIEQKTKIISINIYLVLTAAITSGFGISYNVFRNSNAGLTTALQGNVGYRFSDITTGGLALGLSVKVGL